MKKQNIWKALVAAGALAVVTAGAAGGIAAYFTDTEEKVNHFTVGKIEIDLQEPEWEKKPDEDKDGIPDEAEDLTPGKELKKDPMVKNTGINDAFMFLTVEIPCRELVTVNQDGTRNPKTMTELYSYRQDSSWKKLGSCKVLDKSGKQTGRKYLYAYAQENGVCRTVKPEETTAPLFKSILFANVMEGQGVEEQAFDVVIDAYAIQTADLGLETQDASRIWQIITNQKELTEAYEK
ncbi:MAG: SipW-dependent-type signal peptide-containing protein [Clostridiales bacterium]|nr:SipW-dependent-type signal peptide-containing protein [Clostridiales bacterium]